MTSDQHPSSTEDIKAKMREALAHKNTHEKGVHAGAPAPEKAHGSQVADAAPKMHRRKAGGGGA